MKIVRVLFVLLSSALISFVNTAQAAPSRFELQDNRVIIQVYINGQGPFAMMFDTGATNILSDDVANALSLNRYNKITIGGGGENTVYASYCDVQRLEVSDQTLLNSRFLCMNVSEMQKAIGWPKLDGLIGYEVFSRFLTEINFDTMQISLQDFSARRLLPSDAQRVPFTFQGYTPAIDAVLDGVPGRFLIDTGDRASATLSLPFIQNNSLREKYNVSFATMTGYGIGGPLSTSMAFASGLQFGDLSFSNTLIRLPTINSKALNDPAIAGTIGTGLLRQFNLVFDYPRREMILSKNSAFTQDRFFDRSGMWISPSEEGFEIRDVLEGGPAWKAGLRPNQHILSVDGIEAKEMDILAFREQLKDSQFQKVVVVIRTDIGTRRVTIFLKDLITIPQ